MATLADYGPEVRAEVKQVREVVATLHEQLIKWNLVVWTAGNVSQRLHTADLMVIKPSGLRYEYLTPSSMVVCDLDGNVQMELKRPDSTLYENETFKPRKSLRTKPATSIWC